MQPPSDPHCLEGTSQLSSGHKIVVLTMTKLVEVVEEASVALLDEPEAHLHPPLLSAFTRALSDLLEDRNGVAIIATHSPVVLQEVPESCGWAIRRFGTRVRARRLKQETFGEGVGTLTSRVFGFEVTTTGCHQLMQKAIDSTDGSYDDALSVFGVAVGGEGRAILANLADNEQASRVRSFPKPTLAPAEIFLAAIDTMSRRSDQATHLAEAANVAAFGTLYDETPSVADANALPESKFTLSGLTSKHMGSVHSYRLSHRRVSVR